MPKIFLDTIFNRATKSMNIEKHKKTVDDWFTCCFVAVVVVVVDCVGEFAVGFTYRIILIGGLQ